MNTIIDGISIHYELRGTGEPILFVHGFPLSGELWMPLVPALEGEFRLIIPDLRGHGRSQVSETASMARYADDLAGLLDGIGEDRPVVLVGMSMGGYIAFEFCRRYPERFRALILIDTRAEADSAEAVEARRDLAARVKNEGSGVAADTMLPKLFGPQASDALKATWHEIMAGTSPDGIAAALGAMAARPDSFATLESLSCPVLIVVGRDDALTPPECAERMKRAAPGARLVVIPGAGHMSPVEQPEALLSSMRGFL